MEPNAAERRLLAGLHDQPPLELEDACRTAGFDAVPQVLAAAERLIPEGLVEIDEQRTQHAALTVEGQAAAEEGLPERRARTAMDEAGGHLAMAALGAVVGKAVPVAVGWLKRKGWADIEKHEDGNRLVARGAAPRGADEDALAALAKQEAVDVPEDLVQRGLVEVHATTRRRIALTQQGQEAAAALEGPIGEDVTQITPELVARWQDLPAEQRKAMHLRPFAFDAQVAPRVPGKPHPLSQLMAQTRSIFWRMGFQEVRGDYVESAYWNMDALFIPQDHPARELQDTFYLADPEQLDVDPALLERTADVHVSGGGTGSTGWGGAFDPAVSRRALLRTHTTNTSVRYLAEHFGPGADKDRPHRVFGLGRVFRNETMDATHLPEFHQIEGIVTEPGATFDMLVGLCRHFFGQLGFPEVRFRPAYFPYTEPSMEIEVHYNGKWMELGGCGVFRPEVTEPLGVEHPVLAWGFGLERLAMMRLGLKDIRQLYMPDLKWLRMQPLL